MIPAGDDVVERGVPVVVVALLLANASAFAYEVALAATDEGALAALVEHRGLVPREFLRALSDPSAAATRVWLTPLTSMFLHAGLLHLLGNALYLWVFGRRVERLLGPPRFALFYVVCGLAAAAVHVASDPRSYLATVGASGAISGVLGGYLVAYPTARLRLLWPALRIPAVGFLGLWIVIQVMFGVEVSADGEAAGGAVAWWAHVGGFAAGVALSRSMWLRRPARARARS